MYKKLKSSLTFLLSIETIYGVKAFFFNSILSYVYG